jgi:TonB family protein
MLGAGAPIVIVVLAAAIYIVVHLVSSFMRYMPEPPRPMALPERPATSQLDRKASPEASTTPIDLPAVTVRNVASHQTASPHHAAPRVGQLMSGPALTAPSPEELTSGPRASERVPMSIGESVPVDGILTPAVVVDELEKRKEAVTLAYVRALRDDPTLSGEMVIRFTVDRDGAVEHISVARDTVGDASLTKQVKHVIGGWRFPASREPVQVVYPFVFRPLSE